MEGGIETISIMCCVEKVWCCGVVCWNYILNTSCLPLSDVYIYLASRQISILKMKNPEGIGFI